MRPLQAHEVIAKAYHADPGEIVSWLPDGCEAQHPCGVDPTVALITGGVALSGMLSDCETLADLREGFEHFASLLSAGIITPEDWNQASLDVIDELLQWGESLLSPERN